MKKILVIEDEQFVRENIVEILESSGYAVISASHGREGIELARQHLPDMIICDVMMPEVDGHGVLQALRLHSSTAHIPFVFLTARADISDVRTGMNLGADDYIPKPFRVSELLASIKARLDKQRTMQEVAEEKLAMLRASISLALPHEFLTPLSGILGLSELLLSSYDLLSREEIMEMLTHLHASARRIHHLVQNFLLYARLISEADAIRMRLEHEITPSPSDIVRDVVEAKAQEESREGDIVMAMAQDVIPVAMSSSYLTKIAEEIVDNALKYSLSGTIVSIRTQYTERMFVIEVHNTGRTLTPEQIAAIGAYTQFDRQIYEQQGSGLGLSIVKKLTELHNGYFSLQSADGQTTVRIHIPCAPLHPN
ncbi:MAG: response regulator [Bacteroidota bacterium]|nr:response regulator [Candidatus Kapabacteria bacterium]MDW8220073.1 response regulator [Bacteroidota bacterium]